MSVLKKTDYLPGLILTGFVALLIIIGFFPGSASAEPQTYGPWFQGSKNSAENWQADVTPWNATKSETINSGCIVDGKPISDNGKIMMSSILSAAGSVYNGSFGVGALAVNKSSSKIPIDDKEKLKEGEKGRGVGEEEPTFFEVNGGYPKGPEGYRLFLEKEKELLRNAKWIDYSQRQVIGNGGDKIGEDDYQAPNGTWIANTIDPKTNQLQTDKKGLGDKLFAVGVAAVGITVGGLISPAAPWIGGGIAVTSGLYAASVLFGGQDDVEIPKEQKRLATLLPAADNPLETAFKLPFGCSLPVPPSEPPDIKGLIENPVAFLIGAIVGVLDKVVQLPYDLVKDRAWQWSFMTPHTERGDLLWQLPTSCVAEGAGKGKAATIPNACDGATNLGFSTERLSVQDQKAPFLSMSHFAQWLISGFYFIIFFTAIVFFIMKGTRSRVLNVLTIIPRVLLSIVLTIFATFIIGAIISFANFLVTTIFSLGSAWDVGAANVMLAQPDLVMGGIVEPGGSILRLIVKILITYFYILFVATAIVRQIALVILIVLAPVAIFCIINPSWQQYFNKWFRTLLAVAFIPVILAFLLKLGLIVNPAITNPDATYGSTTLGLFSLVMLLAVLWAMARVLRASRNFILGQSSLATGAMAGAGDKLNSWGLNHGGALGRAASRAGRNLSLSSENAGALGSMVPPDKVLGGALGGLSAAGGGGSMGALKAGLGGQITPTHSTVPDRIQGWQHNRRNNFENANTIREAPDRAAFTRAQTQVQERIGRINQDIRTVPENRRGQWLIAQRDAIVAEAMTAAGGLPQDTGRFGGRALIETSRENATRAIQNQITEAVGRDPQTWDAIPEEWVDQYQNR